MNMEQRRQIEQDFAKMIARPKPYRMYVTQIVMVILFCLLVAMMLTGPAYARSQQCDVVTGECTGGGPPPVPPKKARKLIHFEDSMLWFYRVFRFRRQIP